MSLPVQVVPFAAVAGISGPSTQRWTDRMPSRLKELGLENDPDDKLPLSEAGEWAAEKHRLLAHYVDASQGARGKLARFGASCTYTDLFSGPGRQYVEETDEIIDGSPIVAWEASRQGMSPFTQVYISDRKRFVQACEKRLVARGAPVTVAALDAVQAAATIAPRLDRKALHVVFADPYNLKDLHWQVFEPFIALPRVDFIVHFSVYDLNRNLLRYFQEDPSPLDLVAPGWREHVEERGEKHMRLRFFEYWVGLFTARGFQLADAVPLIVSATSAPLYRLVLLSRHKLAKKLWNSIAEDVSQSKLFSS